MDKTIKNIAHIELKPEDIHFWTNSKDGCDNASILFDGKRSRLRAGIIIMKSDKILLGEEEDEPGAFSLPGGSIEKGETPIEAAIREAQEEVGITAKNVEYAGIDYCECHDEVKDWVKENVPEEEWWYNYYTCLCIGEYDKEYKGKVEKEDKDASMKRSAKFYNIYDVIDNPSFKYAWKVALYNFGYLDDKPEELIEKIVKKGSKWQVQSEKGRNMGTYDTKEEAKKRLQQIEYFKHLNEAEETDTFKPYTAGFIKEDGSLLLATEDEENAHYGLLEKDPELDEKGYPEFSNTHFEDDTCVRIYKEPNTKQYERLEEIIDQYLDSEGYCKVEIYKNGKYDFYVVYSLYENACGDTTWEESVGNWTGYKIIRIIKNYFDNKSILTEETRASLINKSKSGDAYANKKGNRWTRKNACSIANTVKDYNKIDMNTFWKEDKLKFDVKVQGETDTYDVTIAFNGILPKIEQKIHNNKNLLEHKCIYDALIQAINSGDVAVSCTCKDYLYRLKYWNSKNGSEANEKETRAADKTNPENTKGLACKHILAVLNNVEWLKKIASVINNYSNYAKDNLENLYAKYIFPKLYGMTYNKAIQLTLDDFDERGNLKDDLKSDEATINLANALGKNRGKFKKGSNKNPSSKSKA